jgi:hypothetical protein
MCRLNSQVGKSERSIKSKFSTHRPPRTAPWTLNSSFAHQFRLVKKTSTQMIGRHHWTVAAKALSFVPGTAMCISLLGRRGFVRTTPWEGEAYHGKSLTNGNDLHIRNLYIGKFAHGSWQRNISPSFVPPIWVSFLFFIMS